MADHWYPSDAAHRAKIDEYLAWHHTNLRIGAAMIFRKEVNLSHDHHNILISQRLRQKFHREVREKTGNSDGHGETANCRKV